MDGFSVFCLLLAGGGLIFGLVQWLRARRQLAQMDRMLDRALEGQHVSRFEPLDRLPRVEAKRFVTTGGHYAFLKIAEGCDKRCTYCIIPSLRGSYRSFPMEELVAEAGNLAEQGVKELILVAQETTLYGVDLYGRKSLPELLRRLAAVDGIQWIRIQYCLSLIHI
mgnify:CR=1 FL=1